MQISNTLPSANVQLPFSMITYIVEQLPLSYQMQLFQLLSEKIASQSVHPEIASTKLPLTFGAGKDFITYIAPDFNEPLGDFKEYMP